jgi:hypothetical protein
MPDDAQSHLSRIAMKLKTTLRTRCKIDNGAITMKTKKSKSRSAECLVAVAIVTSAVVLHIRNDSLRTIPQPVTQAGTCGASHDGLLTAACKTGSGTQGGQSVTRGGHAVQPLRHSDQVWV